MIFTPIRRWPFRVEDLPWLDQPDAFQKIETSQRQNKINDVQAAFCRKWAEDGYIVLEKAVSAEEADAYSRDFDSIWQGGPAVKNLTVECVRLHDQDSPRNLKHSQILELPLAEREAMKKRLHWRIHAMHSHFASAMQIQSNPLLKQTAELLLGKKASPTYSISFFHGSCQDLHQDLAVFHIYPRNFLIGAWVALEDVSPEAGPLIFYPGSHHVKDFFPEYDNYPQTTMHTADAEGAKRYKSYVKELSGRYEKKSFLAKKGDVLLWHPMLIHGGEKNMDPSLTRRSYVLHFVGDGCNVQDEISGPFLW